MFPVFGLGNLTGVVFPDKFTPFFSTFARPVRQCPMTMTYFEKNALFPPLIAQAPPAGLSLAVTIPCYDEPDLLRTLKSVAACALPAGPVEVLVVVNSAADAPAGVMARNADTVAEAQTWAQQNMRPGLTFHLLHFPDLPPKHAGVGLARKIAMDEAARRLTAAGNPRGIIACLDADSRVQPNYLQALDTFFLQHPDCPAAGIYYEHPLDGDEFSPSVYTAIARYELHLRYYVQALRWAGLRAATQTVGSAMAVRADAYQAQGGMNRRQAGEDFYFLHKFTPLGGFGEIRSTTVIPSPRPSHRVPFGTGKAVGALLAGDTLPTYAPETFRDLKVFLDGLEVWAGAAGSGPGALPPAICTFLEKEKFPEKIREIRANTAGQETFRKRFFRWFDPFLAMKYVHYARDHFYPNVPAEEAAAAFLVWAKGPHHPLQNSRDARSLLLIFRQTDLSDA